MKDKYIDVWVKPYDKSLKAYVGRGKNNDLDIIGKDIVTKLGINSKDRVLDVCCGNGLLTKRIAKYCNEVQGVDFSEILIKTAKERSSGQNIFYYLKDALNSNKIFPEKSFDKIYCYFSFQHFDHSNGKILITNLFPLLKDNGMFLIGDIPDKRKKWTAWHNTWRRRVGYLRQYIYRRISGERGEDSLGWWYHPNQIRGICNELNLRCEILEQDEGLPHAHYRFDAIISKKPKHKMKSGYDHLSTRENLNEKA